MATMILTAVGTAIGGPIGGALGALAGRAFDSAVLLKPKGREGPRISELQVQTSSYGSQVPQIFGAMRVAGTVIWATDLRESKVKQGGGKGQPSVTSYSYAASFAVALSARRVRSVGRIWADGNLLRGAAGDFKSALGAFRLHDGGADQPVDPLIGAAQGIGVTPAHRGIAYAVFEDLQLADFGNRIPSLTFEVFADDAPVMAGAIAGALSGGAIGGVDGAMQGYAASGADARTALQPLVDIFGLTLRDAAAGLSLVAPGAVETMVTHAMRVARLNGKAETAVEQRRAVAQGVPLSLSLRHYDPARDYQAGVQKAVRGGVGRIAGAIEAPASIDTAAARALAEDRLAAAWAERSSLTVLCGWEALAIDPGAVVRVEGQAGRWQVRASEWEAMGVRLTLTRLTDAPARALTASAGAPVLQPDQPHGPTTLMLVDLPPVSDTPAAVPLVVVAAAGASDGWRGAALFSVTPGSGEAVPVGETALPARMGVVVTPPGDASALLVDQRNSMEVEMLADWMTPELADDAALARGGNLCLAGGELMQFGSVVQTGTRRFRLSRLWRGRRGTEAMMTGHAAGEAFLMIEAERLSALPADMLPVGGVLSMLAIGIGDAEPATAQCVVHGAALTPLSPARESDGAGGAMLRWTRRSRAGWRWADGVDAPLGEEREAWRVTLRDGDAIVRVAEVAAAAWQYGAAMRAEDAAAGHGGPLTAQVQQIGTFAIGRAATIIV